MVALASATRPVTFERERGVYRIELSPGLAHARVTVGEGPDRTERLQRILAALSSAGIPIFLIKLHPDCITFGVEDRRLEDVQRCLEGAAASCEAERDLSLVTVLATNMSDLTGVMVSIADSLQRAGVHLIGVGDSHNSVQLLIDGARGKKAVAELEATFAPRRPDA